MRFELAQPGSLYHHQDLTTLINHSDVAAELSAENGSQKDITELNPELLTDTDFLTNVENMRQYFFPFRGTDEGELATLRAVGFAQRLAVKVAGSIALKADFSDIPKHLYPKDLAYFCQATSSRYIIARGPINRTVGEFLPIISPDPELRVGARLAAAMHLRGIDRHLQAEYTHRQIKSFLRELSAWDGLLTEFK